MGIVATTLSFIFLVISIVIKKTKSIKPSTVFFALWTFILFLSSLNLYNINMPSNEAYLLIILMLIFFFVGTILGYKLKVKSFHILDKYRKVNKKYKVEPRYILFFSLSLIRIIFVIMDCIIIFREYINGTPMWQIRNWLLEPIGSENPILSRRSLLEEAFRTIILSPFSDVVPPITAYIFFNSDNKKKKILFLANSILMLILSSLSGGGGRIGFIYYIGCFLLSFFIFCKNTNLSKKVIKKYIRVLCLFIIIGLLFVIGYTIIRSGKGAFIKQGYIYFALPPTLLSEWLPKLKESANTFGFLTIFGVHSYFFRALEYLNLEFLVPNIYNISYKYILNAEIFINVGSGISNAFVTPIYYFFLDGGYPFVCMASLFFGYIVIAVQRKFEENINIRSFIIYSFVVYATFLSFMRIQTAMPGFIISFVFAILCTKKIKDKNNEYKS